ncbi:MAG TPA: FAD-dependent monooxygenase, partial [Bryobacteraceae bacterium]
MGRERLLEVSPEAACDALIVGGGPAGATAARLLAQWGYVVAIETRPPTRPALAECLPPSAGKLFRFLGIDADVERAGFYRT